MEDKDKLAKSIWRCFGIDEKILLGRVPVDKLSIAQRMRWGSARKTTRPEDIAYCLLGIFDVNMPLPYGKGQKAFTRLQEEIIKRSDDHSIFSWINGTASRTSHRGLFARLLAEFQHCYKIECILSIASQLFAVTNRGLDMLLPLCTLNYNRFEYLASLNC